VETTSWDGGSERAINFPVTKFVDDWQQQADFMARMTNHIREKKAKIAAGENAEQPLYDCLNRMGDMKPGQETTFFPVFLAELNAANPTSSYTSSCFETFDMSFAYTSPTSFSVTVNLGNKKSLTCHEIMLFANTEAWHMETFYGNGAHVLNFNMPSLDE